MPVANPKGRVANSFFLVVNSLLRLVNSLLRLVNSRLRVVNSVLRVATFHEYVSPVHWRFGMKFTDQKRFLQDLVFQGGPAWPPGSDGSEVRELQNMWVIRRGRYTS